MKVHLLFERFLELKQVLAPFFIVKVHSDVKNFLQLICCGVYYLRIPMILKLHWHQSVALQGRRLESIHSTQ